jgi:hypothetical protein
MDLGAGASRLSQWDLARLLANGGRPMVILKYVQFSITMEIYTQASSKATRDALKRLGESLSGEETPE